MEPMTLGSAPSSPSSPTANPNYLPPFLMGNNQPATPMSSHTPERSKDYSYMLSPSAEAAHMRGKIFSPNYVDSPGSSDLNVEKPGPPKQGLFDTIESKKTPTQIFKTNSFFDVRNDEGQLFRTDSFTNTSDVKDNCLWITVFGFPSNCASVVLARFANCGTVVEKRFPSQGNWVNLKYSTPQEAARALALNGKLISNNLMVGVVPFHNKQANKENDVIYTSPMRVRPLRHSAASPQSSNTVLPPQNVPQKSTGLVTKAMEYVFGW